MPSQIPAVRICSFFILAIQNVCVCVWRAKWKYCSPKYSNAMELTSIQFCVTSFWLDCMIKRHYSFIVVMAYDWLTIAVSVQLTVHSRMSLMGQHCHKLIDKSILLVHITLLLTKHHSNTFIKCVWLGKKKWKITIECFFWWETKFHSFDLSIAIFAP